MLRLHRSGDARVVESVGVWKAPSADGIMRPSRALLAAAEKGEPVQWLDGHNARSWQLVLDSLAPSIRPRALVRLEGRDGPWGLLLLGQRPHDEPHGKDERDLLGAIAGLFTVLERARPEAPGPRRRKGPRQGQGARTAGESELEHLRRQHPPLRGYVGESTSVRRILGDLVDVSGTSCPVLLEGESGTGKELLARITHELACGSDAPFEAISCGAIPEALIESELFGHVAGAFTGANRAHRGVFERAEGGTVFLDEITEAPQATQVKLLRVLQEGTFLPVGGERLLPCVCRIVAATNRDLRSEVAGGRFREDLYYRLNVFPIVLPPLRERQRDIPLLVDRFLHQHCEEIGRTAPSVQPAAMRRMSVYGYPGNVRELQNVVRALLVEGRSARTITDASVISVFSRHRVVDRLPDAPSESSTTRTAAKSCGEIGEWVLDELRKAHFNFALARRTLEERRYSSPDPKSVPVFSRASLTYYFQGEALKALLKEGWNRAAASNRLAGTSRDVARVRAKLDRMLDKMLRVLQGGGRTAQERLTSIEAHFSKLPECYQIHLREIVDGLERGVLSTPEG